jgi:hypothetical protein
MGVSGVLGRVKLAADPTPLPRAIKRRDFQLSLLSLTASSLQNRTSAPYLAWGRARYNMDYQDDFFDFVQDLVNGNALSNPAAGVAARVVEEGSLQRLTAPQHRAFAAGVNGWLAEHFPGHQPPFVNYGEKPAEPACTSCSNDVPWCEVYIAGAMEDGRCTWCVKVHDKDD